MHAFRTGIARPSRNFLGVLPVLAASLLASSACTVATPPPNAHVVVFRGDAYARGLEHGRRFATDIREFTTRLLTVSLIPLLNQEQVSMAPILRAYTEPAYLDRKFARRMLADSAHALEDGGWIPEPYLREMHGIADGAGVPYEDVLVLNTFVDTMLAFRATALFVQDLFRPSVASAGFPAAASDGVDTDGDGQVDEPDDATLSPYHPRATASFVEVPTGAALRLVLKDAVIAGLGCIDPQNVRPLDLPGIDRACVLPGCLDPACGDVAPVPPECILARDTGCLPPRLSATCFDPACVEVVDPGCVDETTVRLQVDGRVYTRADPQVVVTELPIAPPGAGQAASECGPFQVDFTPEGGWPAASLVSVTVQAMDRARIWSPAPFHARPLRDERISFSTSGYAAARGAPLRPVDLPNAGPADPGAPPTAFAFAARGTATPDGAPVAAHHYALVDADIAHEHALVSIVVPPESEGRPHVVFGWTGLVWGFAGMNADGVVFTANHSDTLDNPLVGGVLRKMFEPDSLAVLLERPDMEGLAEVLRDTHLLSDGLPIGLAGREVLAHASTTDQALRILYGHRRTYGWNVLLADAAGALAAVELDGAQIPNPWESPGTSPDPVDEDGFFLHAPGTGPADLGPDGRPFASVGPDDLRTACHFVENVQDVNAQPLLGAFSPRPQQAWTGAWYRSVRTDARLAEALRDRYGHLDAAGAIDLLRTPDLVDRHDSMLAAVFEPARRVVHWAMGEVPATEAPFETLDLASAAAEAP